MRYYAVNRICLSARLAFGKKLGSNSTFVYSKKLCAKYKHNAQSIFLY